METWFLHEWSLGCNWIKLMVTKNQLGQHWPIAFLITYELFTYHLSPYNTGSNDLK